MENNEILLATRGLKKYFPVKRKSIFVRAPKKFVRAVDDVSIVLPKRRTLAVVGESGCGKTTLARMIAMLIQPSEGKIIFDGNELTAERVNRDFYKQVQMVFQDPDSSLDPRLDVASIIMEPVKGLIGGNTVDMTERVFRVLESVGLPEEFASRVPAQLSGGQKQRVAIARAIATRPKLVILDEPTSALDVSVQAQILSLLLSLQEEYELSYLLITHNIAVAEYFSDLVTVMYSGNVVEYGPTDQIISKPRHPYTIMLISAAPVADPRRRSLLKTEIKGEVPSAISPPSGCKFHPRCPYAEKICGEITPPLNEISAGHFVACHFVAKTDYPSA